MITFGADSQWAYDPGSPLRGQGWLIGTVYRGKGRGGTEVAVKVVPASGDVDGIACAVERSKS